MERFAQSMLFNHHVPNPFMQPLSSFGNMLLQKRHCNRLFAWEILV